MNKIILIPAVASLLTGCVVYPFPHTSIDGPRITGLATRCVQPQAGARGDRGCRGTAAKRSHHGCKGNLYDTNIPQPHFFFGLYTYDDGMRIQLPPTHLPPTDNTEYKLIVTCPGYLAKKSHLTTGFSQASPWSRSATTGMLSRPEKSPLSGLTVSLSPSVLTSSKFGTCASSWFAPPPRAPRKTIHYHMIPSILLGLVADFFAGAFLCNAIPHLVSGLCGDALPTPFARPPGRAFPAPW